MNGAYRWGCLLSLLTLMVAAGGGLALAQDGRRPTPGRAEDHAERAEQAYKARRYGEAAEEFEQAYNLGGRPSHLYNMAQAHRMAGNLLPALQCYKGYLQLMPNPPNLAEIERRI